MRIYKMTATFGKLENQTLTLEPSLNILSQPNEWGKSTWCAFLATMLYGLDTREKTTKTTLAIKERYAPWSGAPMSGRIDLNWNDRDITIERWTKGRTMLGEFRAYETESGLEVAELTATNCGEVLLGVEKSVFLRAGFIRLADLPVTADESLRRRLNALVTTGDESGAGDTLAKKLKDTKNKIRYNKSGLLPQAETQHNDLQNKLTELQTLRAQTQRLQQRCTEIEEETAKLENHKLALQYAAAQENIRKVEQAHLVAEAAAEAMAKAEDRCAELPSREEAVAQLHRHSQLIQSQNQLVNQWTLLPQEPQPPQVPQRYQGMDPEDAVLQAEEDSTAFIFLEKESKKPYKGLYVFPGMVAVFVLLGVLIGNPWIWIAVAIGIVGAGLGLVLGYLDRKKRNQREMDELRERYPGIQPDLWVEDATLYAEGQRQYAHMLETALSQRRSIRQQIDAVEEELAALMGGASSQDFLLNCNEIIAAHDELAQTRQNHQQAAAHAAALGSMLRQVSPAPVADTMTLSLEETEKALSDLEFEGKQLQLRLGQYQGRMDMLGSETALQQQMEAVGERIQKLNQYYTALELAQQTLQTATAELQRRFAPRISQQAQDIFGKLTGGRYDRLNLQQDLSINAASTEDVAMRSAGWRSEGTVDQLYLALRLAIARELTPNAPLVLDDALVRFDDIRHAAAMDILRKEAENRQVILFTCQSREK